MDHQSDPLSKRGGVTVAARVLPLRATFPLGPFSGPQTARPATHQLFLPLHGWPRKNPAGPFPPRHPFRSLHPADRSARSSRWQRIREALGERLTGSASDIGDGTVAGGAMLGEGHPLGLFSAIHGAVGTNGGSRSSCLRSREKDQWGEVSQCRPTSDRPVAPRPKPFHPSRCDE